MSRLDASSLLRPVKCAEALTSKLPDVREKEALQLLEGAHLGHLLESDLVSFELTRLYLDSEDQHITLARDEGKLQILERQPLNGDDRLPILDDLSIISEFLLSMVLGQQHLEA